MTKRIWVIEAGLIGPHMSECRLSPVWWFRVWRLKGFLDCLPVAHVEHVMVEGGARCCLGRFGASLCMAMVWSLVG